jgi:hypothetical protein
MSTVLGFKDIIDLPEWRPLAPSPHNATVGVSMAWDGRNSEVRSPYILEFGSAALVARYNVKNDDWLAESTPATSTMSAGSCAVFVPSWGPYGVITGTHTTSSFTIGTALPSAVAANQLANRGDGLGFKVRLVGKTSGKTEERWIVANTGGTTPVIYVDTPFTFTPQNNDVYEFLSGAVMLVGGGTPTIRKYDCLTGSYSAVNATNFIATVATDGQALAMDEQYVPYDKAPGEGFLGVCTATASGATSITGQAAAGDAAVLLNEYRNFQVRIVEDTGAPLANGQRRKITSHTAGPSAVYSVAAWSVTPSADAKFVIEYNNDILAWNGATTVTYSKLAGFNADANWSTAAIAGGATQYANPPAANAAGALAFPSYGIEPDAAKSARHSFFFRFRGGAAALGVMDLFDIAAGASGVWTSDITYGGKGGYLPTTGNHGAYDGATLQGRYGYLSQNGTQRFGRFDVLNRVLEPWAYLRYPQSTVTVGGKSALTLFVDGATKLGFLITRQQALTPVFGVALQR